MTIEQLLDLPTDELNKLSTGPELDRILSMYLPFTRPAKRRDVMVVKVAGASDALARALAGDLHADEPAKPKMMLKPLNKPLTNK